MSEQMDPTLIAGLKEQLKTELAAAVDRRRQAAESRHWLRKHHAFAAEHDERAAQFRQLLRIADPEHADAYADPQQERREYSQRAAILAGARELLDFLEENPDLPVHTLQDSFVLFPRAGDADANEAEVDRIARIMGVPSGRETPARHYRATKAFGPGGVVTLESYTCERTDVTWKTGDPYPDWWPTDEAVAAAAQLADAPQPAQEAGPEQSAGVSS